MNQGRTFAGFDSSFEEASYVLVGVPFDKTSSFRTGARKGPDEIRNASYCFEPYLLEHEVSLNQFEMFDFGDLKGYDEFSELRKKIREVTADIVEKGKFPIFLGGEHSISVPVVSSVKKRFPDLNILVLDAHLDFRDSYEGLNHSHATVSRRIAEIVGLENIYVSGVRSISASVSDIEKPNFCTSEQIEESMDPLEIINEHIEEPIYLSIDMDVVDPSFAPGVGNPEPFGLSSYSMKELVSNLATSLVGMDIVEVNPKYDNSEITSNLAARLIYELIGKREKKK